MERHVAFSTDSGPEEPKFLWTGEKLILHILRSLISFKTEESVKLRSPNKYLNIFGLDKRLNFTYFDEFASYKTEESEYMQL